VCGRYELGALLGQGGMGVVYRAVDRQNPERALAVKCIRADAVSESSLSLFKAEFKEMSEMRQSIALAEQQGSRMMLADAYYELGRRERDPDEARRHLQIALDLYDASDAAPYVQFVRRALASLA